jgi:hypothetical protein
MTYTYTAYEPSLISNEQRVDNFMIFEFCPLRITYIQLIAERLKDYYFIQSIQLINNPLVLCSN